MTHFVAKSFISFLRCSCAARFLKRPEDDPDACDRAVIPIHEGVSTGLNSPP